MNKKVFRSFVTFTRTERLGLVALVTVLVILIAVRFSMPLWVHPEADAAKEAKLTAAWEKFKREQPAIKDSIGDNNTSLPAIININTADSATLVRLKGIGPVIAGKIIARRTKKGPFTHISQLRELGRFDTATFNMLKAHLIISETR